MKFRDLRLEERSIRGCFKCECAYWHDNKKECKHICKRCEKEEKEREKPDMTDWDNPGVGMTYLEEGADLYGM